jgi:hypothetical protein
MKPVATCLATLVVVLASFCTAQVTTSQFDNASRPMGYGRNIPCFCLSEGRSFVSRARRPQLWKPIAGNIVRAG